MFNKNQAWQVLQRGTMCITDADHDYILEKSMSQEEIEYERHIDLYHNPKNNT